MGFNKRKMEDRRRKAAEQEAAARRALGPQIIEDSVKLVETWNARQAAHMPMLFSPTIEAAITAGYWFLRARCPACRTTGDVDLRTLDWHHGAAVTALTPALSCRACRPNACADRSRALPRSITQSAAATGGSASERRGVRREVADVGNCGSLIGKRQKGSVDQHSEDRRRHDFGSE
jgi:hypothetical protein